MEKSLEENLYQAILAEDEHAVANLISLNANPNKTTSHGKTCLGEAASIGNINILKLLIDVSKKADISSKATSQITIPKKRSLKSQKRKHKLDASDETVVKCRNYNDRIIKDYYKEKEESSSCPDKNQGYYVFIHSEGSSSDESKIPNPTSPSLLTPSPQAELEWDEDIGNAAPPTSEDETWSSMYKWYASILESTGAAIASASMLTNGIDQQDAFMRTALHYSAEHGHLGAAKLLLEAGCKVDVTSSDGLTPLHVAVVRNHVEIVQKLLESGSNVNFKTHEKMTPLHFASSRGYLVTVQILVNNGSYIEARDTNERTALYLAAGRGHVDIVKFLISKGANVNGEELHGYTPLCEAVWQRYKDVVELLISSGARITHSHKLLHNAVIQRQDDIVKMLVTAGGGINLHNDSGDTPLLLAVRLSQLNLTRILIQHGANVNACNSITGASALHIAVENIRCHKQFEALLIYLLEHKIDMNSTALTGDTALNRALLINKDFAASLLIRYGSDVNACDLHSCGLDNLSIASRRRSITLASMLVKAGHYLPMPEGNPPSPEHRYTAHWLHHVSKHPLELADICRINIRRLFGNRILFRYIASLPLPKSLQKFLMMEGESL